MRDDRQELINFAEGPQSLDSPLYGALTRAILGSSRLMDVVSHTPAGQPLPLHMLAAVQFLLEPSDRLALYYPTLTDEPRPVGDGAVDNGLAESLEEFVIANERKIIELLETRITQTNEVGRLGAIMPGLCLVHRRTGLPLSTVEIGTSAGLLLGWPDYFFDYGEQGELGNPLSSVRMRPELRGQEKLPLTDTMPPVATRVGLDLSPLDVADADDARWLAALVWPDHGPRIARLRHAIDTIRDNPPKLITANAPDRLPGVLASLPEDSARVVFHSISIYQMDPDTRATIDLQLMSASVDQPVYRLSFEFDEGEKGIKQPHLRLTTFDGGYAHPEHLATAQYHGRWIEWLAG